MDSPKVGMVLGGLMNVRVASKAKIERAQKACWRMRSKRTARTDHRKSYRPQHGVGF